MRALKKGLCAFLCPFFASASVAAAPPLIGDWQSSRELTMSFIENHVRLKAETESFLRQLSGHMTLRFDAEYVTLDLPDLTIEINGKKHPMTGFREKSRYKVLFSSDTKIVIQSEVPSSQQETVQIFYFVDDKTMWVYGGNNDPGLPDIHYREYFVRTR
ncbi:MAG: hypothetical protein LBO00_00195 [Zoogloeaceae bacterium]|nr:hypothetical protein [Zoogloeaceae bacterium]